MKKVLLLASLMLVSMFVFSQTRSFKVINVEVKQSPLVGKMTQLTVRDTITNYNAANPVVMATTAHTVRKGDIIKVDSAFTVVILGSKKYVIYGKYNQTSYNKTQ